MHKLLTALFLIFTTQTFAVSNTVLDFDVSQVKCTVFGNLKMKISSIEDELGRTGIYNVKSNVKKRGLKCKDIVSKLSKLVDDQRGSLSVEAKVRQSTDYVEDHRGRRNYVCKQIQTTRIEFPLVIDSELTLKFSKRARLTLDEDYGRCPR